MEAKTFPAVDRTLFAQVALQWVRDRHAVRINDTTAELIVSLLEEPPTPGRYPGVEVFLADAGRQSSTSSLRLRKKQLPTPNAWRRLALGVAAAEHLRRHPGASLGACAQELGYADHSALSQLFRRHFGLRAQRVRGATWEELVAAWWEQQQRRRYRRLAPSVARNTLS